MSENKGFLLCRKICFVLLLVAVLCWIPVVGASRSGWQHQEVNWRMTGGRRIKALNYPKGKPLPTLSERNGRRPTVLRKKILTAEAASQLAHLTQESTTPIIANVIDSPPIDGFIPLVAVSITDARNEPYELDAVLETSVTGNYLPDRQADYTIGIFDTGASASIINAFEAYLVGLYDAGLVTSSTVELIGATSSAFAWVSHPLGLFIDGLGAIEPNSLLIDDSNMVGESNVSIIVGDPIDSPNLPTAIGAPLSVFLAADFRNDRQITFTYDNNELAVPDIRFYENSDPCIPNYSNRIYLELRPTDVTFVQYFPCVEIPGIFDCPDGDGSPLYPTTIVDGWWLHQGLFFVSALDLTHGDKSATEKKFMFDTGAQVTVISEAIAARLQLNLANPDFEVEIRDVTGEITTAPGFYIDSLEITATPEWLSFTNVPVVVLDVTSPEGGFLDGITGMNLFVDLNFVFRGGGLPGQGAPFVKFEPIYRIIADIAPGAGDGVVDFLDLALFAEAWLADPMSPNWNSRADMVGDANINFLDFAVLGQHWREHTAP